MVRGTPPAEEGALMTSPKASLMQTGLGLSSRRWRLPLG